MECVLEESLGLSNVDVEITKVAPDFIEDICEIERESFSEPYPSYMLASIARETPETFLVAISRSKVVGYVLTLLNKDEGHVLSIAVQRDFRRKRIGSRLMAEISEVLRRKGIRRIRLEVRLSNHGAKEFYGQLGFREKGLTRGYYRDGEDAVNMVRELS
jgi:ribosomal-protein-alanine N-acetyltransferase